MDNGGKWVNMVCILGTICLGQSHSSVGSVGRLLWCGSLWVAILFTVFMAGT